MPATASKQSESLTMRHLDGCPVSLDPDNADLAARVEQWTAVRPARKREQDGMTYELPPERVRVLHCCECGHLEYVKE